ncbi:MAG: peroxiredoxin [Chloroflexi bacterium]|nr:MAG: peroxiredoxin [Chloroflexota bacterium]TMD98465.1 MAG: peroxiredoxin [Chloroflexota bacterium]
MAVEVGSVAPDFTLKDENGKDVTLSSLRGRNVVLMFYPLAFSGVCTKELRDIASAADRYSASNAEVLAVSVDSSYTLAAFKRDENLSAHLLADFHPKGAVAQQYGTYLDGIGIAGRATFVIDKDGKVVHKVTSEVMKPRDQQEYLTALAACPV